ncbi:MAG: hypothetical protein ACOYOQ_00345 [Microthrixaceae bacterium]
MRLDRIGWCTYEVRDPEGNYLGVVQRIDGRWGAYPIGYEHAPLALANRARSKRHAVSLLRAAHRRLG